MNFSSKIELDEFDEMAFGLPPQGAALGGKSNAGTAEEVFDFLNRKEPPQLKLSTGLGKSPPTRPGPSTAIPLDGLFSDEDEDNLFPAFNKAQPKQVVQAASKISPAQTGSTLIEKSTIPSRLDYGDDMIDTAALTRPVTASSADPLTFSDFVGSGVQRPLTASPGPNMPPKKVTTTASPLPRPEFSADNTSPLPSLGMGSNTRAPVKSSLFKNLAAPPWEKKSNIKQPDKETKEDVFAETAALKPTEKGISQKERRSLISGGSANRASESVQSDNTQVPTAATFIREGSPTKAALDSTDPMIGNLLRGIEEAEAAEHRRITSHHDFIREQTQKAAELQQRQADEFLKQYLSENKKQLDVHLQRLRTGLPLVTGAPSYDAGDSVDSSPKIFALERKVESLEKRLEEREDSVRQFAAQIVQLEEQHWADMRQLRDKHEETLQRTAQSHHDYLMDVQAANEAVRKQHAEALQTLREAVSSKNSIEVVRSTVEHSAQEFAVWRTEIEHKHEMAVRERDNQLQLKDNQIKELASLVERQTESFKIEREALQKRLDEDTKRLFKRESEMDEHLYSLHRERLEFDNDRTKFRAQQTKELQRLEKRMEDLLQEKQTTLESLAEEKFSVDTEKRKLSETVRAIEDKYALELKRKQLNLESAMEVVTAEKQLLEEKINNIHKESRAIKEERERLERDKFEFLERKARVEKLCDDVNKKDLELEQTALKAAKMKRDADAALNEARFLDEEHRKRVHKLHDFLEQLREKEMVLMRQAVQSKLEQQTPQAFAGSSGTMAVIPSHNTPITKLQDVLSGMRLHLLPNPAKDERLQFWEAEKEYLNTIKNTPWVTKRSF